MENAGFSSLFGLVGKLDGKRLELRPALTADVRQKGAKTEFVTQGDSSDLLHLVVEGWAARYRFLPNGSRQITGFLLPGDCCDLNAALGGRVNSSVSTLTVCRIARVSGGELRRLLDTQADVAGALWSAAMMEEAILQSWLLNLGRREAFSRIAHLICELFTRAMLIGMTNDNRMDWPLSQQDIADATGLTSVHVNRTLKRMREEELIHLTGRVLTVRNAEALQRVAGFDPSYLISGRY